MFIGVPGERARPGVADRSPARFADVRWVAETGSTNADAMALIRHGAPEGIVLVADHQTAGRGRRGRTWEAPPGAGLLLSVLLRPPAEVVDLCTMAVGLAAAEAVAEVAGFEPRLKWPNDLVWPGDGSAPDRKLAGILAEADWPAGSTPDAGYRPRARRADRRGGRDRHQRRLARRAAAELADLAVACNHVTGRRPRPGGPAGGPAPAAGPLVRAAGGLPATGSRCSPAWRARRPRWGAGSASTWAATTSRARPSTSPPTATW